MPWPPKKIKVFCCFFLEVPFEMRCIRRAGIGIGIKLVGFLLVWGSCWNGHSHVISCHVSNQNELTLQGKWSMLLEILWGSPKLLKPTNEASKSWEVWLWRLQVFHFLKGWIFRLQFWDQKNGTRSGRMIDPWFLLWEPKTSLCHWPRPAWIHKWFACWNQTPSKEVVYPVSV